MQDRTSEAHPKVMVDFDHHSATHGADPLASFEAVRGRCPVAFTEKYGGYWVVTGHDEVHRIATDPATFTPGKDPQGNTTMNIPPTYSPMPLPPLETEVPRFRDFRQILVRVLSLRAIEAMQPVIDYHTNYFLDQVIERGEMDLVRDFTGPVPAGITMDLLGFDVEDWGLVAHQFQTIGHVAPDQDDSHLVAERKRLFEAISNAVAERRARPRADVMTYVANSMVGDVPITHDEAVGTIFLMITGGMNTTTLAASHSLARLEGMTDVHRRLLTEPAFMRTALEELLRLSTPILSIGRYVTDDVELAGFQMRTGDKVMISWIAANHDPKAFPDPHEMDLERKPNRHLAFGTNPHMCIGLHLGRAMFRTMLRALLERAPDYTVVEAIPSHYRPVENEWESLRIRFTPGERVLPAGAPYKGRYVLNLDGDVPQVSASEADEAAGTRVLADGASA